MGGVLDDGVSLVGSLTMLCKLSASKISSSLTAVGSHLIIDIDFRSQLKSPNKIILNVLSQAFSKGGHNKLEKLPVVRWSVHIRKQNTESNLGT